MPSDLQVRALLECCQEIPCNPCVTACKTGAITKESLTAAPVLHPEKCVGCGLCVAACPGQAIFLQGIGGQEDYATITFPYEFRPLPVQGAVVTAVDRMGRAVCTAQVLSVDLRPAYNRTALVTLKIPSTAADKVRFMERLSGKE